MSTPWSKKESEDRIVKFMTAYDALVKQYEVEFMAFPQFVSSGQHGFNVMSQILPVDQKNRPVPSPLSDDNGIIK